MMRVEIVQSSSFDQANAGLNLLKADGHAVKANRLLGETNVHIGDVSPGLSKGGFQMANSAGQFGDTFAQRIDLRVEASEVAKDQVFRFVSHRLEIDGFATKSMRGTGK